MVNPWIDVSQASLELTSMKHIKVTMERKEVQVDG
jgi:hypothetical protein